MPSRNRRPAATPQGTASPSATPTAAPPAAPASPTVNGAHAAASVAALPPVDPIRAGSTLLGHAHATPFTWRPHLGEHVTITCIRNTPGQVEAIQERVGCVTLYAVMYLNGTGTRIEDWLRADQLARATF